MSLEDILTFAKIGAKGLEGMSTHAFNLLVQVITGEAFKVVCGVWGCQRHRGMGQGPSNVSTLDAGDGFDYEG